MVNLELVVALFSFLFPLSSADKNYTVTNWVVRNDGPLSQLNEGLTGSWTGVQANRSGPVDFQLWFVNSTYNSFTLAILAINWKDKDPREGKIIWSAEQKRPVGRNARWISGSGGNLELEDADGTSVWSTNTFSGGATKLWMTDMGNMVLLTDNDDVKWQAFDYLTDTLMFRRVMKPGMKLTSRSSSTAGEYNLVVENKRLVLYSNFGAQREAYWVWKADATTPSPDKVFLALCIGSSDASINFLCLGTNFNAVSQTNMVDDRECSHISSVGRLYVGSSGNALTLLTLQPNGNLQVLAWSKELHNWNITYSLFGNDSCELPRRCGPYRICKDGACAGCPPPFVDIDSTRRELGCRHPDGSTNFKAEEGCGTDTFHAMDGYHYFASNFTDKWLQNLTAEDCLRKCKENCSCQASFYREDTDGNKYCYTTGNVGTIQNVTSKLTHRAFLRVPVRSTEHNKPKASTIAGATIGGVIGILLLGFFIVMMAKRRGAKHNIESENEEDSILELSIRSSLPRHFTSEELNTITNGYTEELGVGGFGTVYKGTLENGAEVAVKKLEKHATSHHRKQFYAEIEVLGKCKHWNLVQLIGFSSKGSHRTLVYEYMANGSLDSWLFNKERQASLTWDVRFNIAIGTAKGLVYLHEECSEKIIHLDLKPQNILLDSEFNAKIGDFGLSKLVNKQQSQVMTTMKGTPGYLAPEWLVDGLITEKADVYSYGIVVVEIVSGRKYKDLLTDHEITGDGVQNTEGMVKRIIDKTLYEVNEEEVQRALRVALLCMQYDPVQRPNMSRVVQMLLGLVPVPDLQNDDAFWRRNPPVFTSLMKAIMEESSMSSSSSSRFLGTMFSEASLFAAR